MAVTVPLEEGERFTITLNVRNEWRAEVTIQDPLYSNLLYLVTKTAGVRDRTYLLDGRAIKQCVISIDGVVLGSNNVATLLYDGAMVDVDFNLQHGQHPLHVAADAGHIEAIRRWTASGVDVDIRTENNMTPLHKAALGYESQNSVNPAIDLLLSLGADINALTTENQTPLSYLLTDLQNQIDGRHDSYLSRRPHRSLILNANLLIERGANLTTEYRRSTPKTLIQRLNARFQTNGWDLRITLPQ